MPADHSNRPAPDRAPEPLEVPMSTPDEQKSWIDDNRNVNRICYALYAICAVLLVIDPLVHKHGPFEIEHFWGFYGIYSFIVCVLLVLVAQGLRWIVMRSEDYYDR